MLNDDCTANTVIHYHAFIRKALQEAVITELISTNVADKVRKPKKKQFVSQVYNQHEILKLLDILSEEKLYLVVLLTAFYGLRRSEVLGLKWSAIDFLNKKYDKPCNHRKSREYVPVNKERSNKELFQLSYVAFG